MTTEQPTRRTLRKPAWVLVALVAAIAAVAYYEMRSAPLPVAAGQAGVMVAFNPPDVAFVPLAEVLNKVRTVPPASVFVQTARALGIALGD